MSPAAQGTSCTGSMIAVLAHCLSLEHIEMRLVGLDHDSIPGRPRMIPAKLDTETKMGYCLTLGTDLKLAALTLGPPSLRICSEKKNSRLRPKTMGRKRTEAPRTTDQNWILGTRCLTRASRY